MSVLSNCFVETVNSPNFSSYQYMGPLYEEGGEVPIEGTTCHVIYANRVPHLVTYNSVVDRLCVVNLQTAEVVLSADYNDDLKSWTCSGTFTEDVYMSEVIHACRVLKRLHESSLGKV